MSQTTVAKVSYNVAKFLDEKSSSENRSKVELIEEMYQVYLASISKKKDDDNNKEFLEDKKILESLASLEAHLDRLKDADKIIIEKDPEETINLLKRHIKSMTDAAKIYGELSHLISSTTESMKSSVNDIDEKISKSFSRVEKISEICKESAMNTIQSSEKAIGILDTCSSDIFNKVKNEFKQNLDNCYEQSNLRLKIATFFNVLSAVSLILFAIIFWKPVHNYFDDKDTKIETYEKAYRQLSNLVCESNPTGNLKKHYSKYCSQNKG